MSGTELDELAAMTPEQRGPLFAKWALDDESEWTRRGACCRHAGCQKGMIFEYGPLREVRLGIHDIMAPEHCYVLVWNSTPEPDGTRKPYAIRVSGAAWAPLRYDWHFPVTELGSISPMNVCDAIGETFGRAAHAWNPVAES